MIGRCAVAVVAVVAAAGLANVAHVAHANGRPPAPPSPRGCCDAGDPRGALLGACAVALWLGRRLRTVPHRNDSVAARPRAQ
jgi:hypothetical protein